MSTPTIPNGALYMNATVYTGAGSTPQTVVNGPPGASFQPDMVWTKPITSVGEPVPLDSVRGASKLLITSSTAAEGTDTQYLTSFNSNGYSLGTNNWSGTTVVGWQWKGGGAAVSNTDGTITSSVSANQTSGFSVVTYTGTGASGSVGHGLGAVPAMMIVKSRNATQYWIVQHQALTGITWNLYLQATDSQQNDGQFTAKSSTTVSINGGSVTGSGINYVMYCWAPIAGYSAFGSYTGNGSADGPFVYTGFRPRFVMIKVASTTSNWFMFDSARSTYNVTNNCLIANGDNAQFTGQDLDLLSNGFKLRSTSSGTNDTSQTYIYAAFAENPFKYANAR